MLEGAKNDGGKRIDIPLPIEDRVARRQKRQKIQDIVLAGIYTTAAVGMMFAAPNTLQLLAYVKKYVGPAENIDRRMYQALARLRSKGFLTKGNVLTKPGARRACALTDIESVSPKIPLRWDRKWRIFIFDVWERRKNERHRLRGILDRMGFLKLQQSVWLYPYPCEELFVYLRAELRLGPALRYLVVEEIDGDKTLRREFDLPMK